jgi:hypothetical protein
MVRSLSIKRRKQGTYYVQARYAGSSTLKAATSSGRKIVTKQGDRFLVDARVPLTVSLTA